MGRLRSISIGGVLPAMNMQLLEQLLEDGQKAAQSHFEAFIQCVHGVLPDGLRDTVPATIEDMGGLFTASTVEVYLLIFANTPGYESINACFKYGKIPDGTLEWMFNKFAVSIGGGNLFTAPREVTASRLQDAVVMSRRIAQYRDKAAAEVALIEAGSTSDQAMQSKPKVTLH